MNIEFKRQLLLCVNEVEILIELVKMQPEKFMKDMLMEVGLADIYSKYSSNVFNFATTIVINRMDRETEFIKLLGGMWYV